VLSDIILSRRNDVADIDPRTARSFARRAHGPPYGRRRN
jgi:hypothetical protein